MTRIKLADLTALSLLGTAWQKSLPKFLGGGSGSTPWGGKTVTNTNPYTRATRPSTSVTRKYEWTVSKQVGAPDGVQNQLLLINGQFPGPTIEANWGDWVEVKVTNNNTEDGLSFHWHGLLQQEAQWMDGSAGGSQCPIAPGTTFTYRFKPDLYGSTWYHSHYSGQLASGLLGPLIVYGPTNTDHDIDVGPILAHDYYHSYYTDILEGLMREPLAVPASDNNLINGKNQYNGNKAPMASFNFTSTKRMRLRLINPSAIAVQKITIDGHQMSVIANDFVPIVPYTTDVITLAPGQRSDVIVTGLADPKGSFWLRAFKTCSPAKPGNEEAKAAIFYERADRTSEPKSLAGPNARNTYCGNDPLAKTVPAMSITPSATASVTEVIPLVFRSNGTSELWYMQNRTARVNFNKPQLLAANRGQLNFPFIQNVHNYGSNASLRFIIENPGSQPHPIHLHGHNFWILQEGVCTSDKFPADFMTGDRSGVRKRSHDEPESEPESVAALELVALPTDMANDTVENVAQAIEQRDLFSDWWANIFPAGKSATTKPATTKAAAVTNALTSTKAATVNGAATTPATSKAAAATTVPVTNANVKTTNVNGTPDKGHCWDGTIVNANNPMRRDVHMLLPGHYMVMQWNQDNPGLWPLHCHTAWHLSNGFLWNILEQDVAVQRLTIPSETQELCNAWDAWTAVNVVNQIDSGSK